MASPARTKRTRYVPTRSRYRLPLSLSLSTSPRRSSRIVSIHCPMLRRISLGSARNCSRAFSLISSRYRTTGILLRRLCADKPAHATHTESLAASMIALTRGGKSRAKLLYANHTRRAGRLSRERASRVRFESRQVCLITSDPICDFVGRKDARFRHFRPIGAQTRSEERHWLLLLFRRQRVRGSFDFAKR